MVGPRPVVFRAVVDRRAENPRASVGPPRAATWPEERAACRAAWRSGWALASGAWRLPKVLRGPCAAREGARSPDTRSLREFQGEPPRATYDPHWLFEPESRRSTTSTARLGRSGPSRWGRPFQRPRGHRLPYPDRASGPSFGARAVVLGPDARDRRRLSFAVSGRFHGRDSDCSVARPRRCWAVALLGVSRTGAMTRAADVDVSSEAGRSPTRHTSGWVSGEARPPADGCLAPETATSCVSVPRLARSLVPRPAGSAEGSARVGDLVERAQLRPLRNDTSPVGRRHINRMSLY